MGVHPMSWQDLPLRTRSRETALADLIKKLDRYPPDHPDCPRLRRMIADLSADLALTHQSIRVADDSSLRIAA
jgi:hypothetical protein